MPATIGLYQYLTIYQSKRSNKTAQCRCQFGLL